MTKDELIKKHVGYGNPTSIQDWVMPDNWVFAPHVEKAMDEYAKQQSIAFAKWIHKIYIPTAPNPDRWYKMGKIEEGRWSTEELYNKFITEHQSK